MNQISEVSIYEKADIKITNLRAVFGPKTYSISNITSVEGQRIEPSGCLLFFFIITGILFSAIGLPNIIDNQFYGFCVIGILMFGLAFIVFKSSKPTFAVNLTTASGEIKAYTSDNQESILEIVNALNDAIIQKG